MEKIDRNNIKCEICGKAGFTSGNFCHHLRWHHKGYNIKKYYDEFIKVENEGICPVCGKETKFVTMLDGYQENCSVRCSQLNPKTQEKIKKTCLEKYGTEYAFQAEEVKEKINNTFQEKYGCHYLNSLDYKEKTLKTFKEKYGQEVENAFQLEHSKNKAKKTKFKNHGYDSNDEEILAKAFEDNNIKFIYQYKEDRYPWFCDFYLPEKDLFVEVNTFISHNKRWFDPTNLEHLKEAKMLLAKDKNSLYTGILEKWTITDVGKRSTAQKNNLNYVVLWSLEDIYSWIDQGFPIRQDWK